MSAIVLFDGLCNLCSAWVRFVVERDPSGYFKFASLQSDAGQALQREHGLSLAEGDPASVVLIEDGRVWQRSTAALRMARRLRFPWSMGWAFVVVPRFLRDAVYGFIARHRYRWFGKKDVCMVPTPELRARFL